MLIELGVNNDLAKVHSRARRIPGSSVLWNGSKYEAVVLESNKSQPKLWAGLVVAGGLFYGLNAWTAWSSGDLGMSVLSGLLSITSISFAATSLAFLENGSDCAEFLNGLLSIANDWRNDGTFHEIIGKRALLVKLLTRTLNIGQVVYPWLLSLAAVTLPCSPLNMFSSVKIIIGWGGKEGNSATWFAWVVQCAGTAVAHYVPLKAYLSHCAINGLHLFLGSLCQTSLLQFLSNSRPRRRRADLPLPSQFKLYRSCQILNICFNNYYSSVALAAIGSLIVCEVSGTYLILKILGGSSNLSLLIKVIMITLCPIYYLFHVMAVSEAAGVNTHSLSVLTKVMRRRSVTTTSNNKLIRRQIRSAWPLNIQLGDCNFIEAGTTLVMLDFTLDRLLDLLLIGK